jgi:casein kinase II subunit beta
MAYDDSSASGRNEPWIQWFCGLKGHEMFCEVERSYIEDGFNLYGLRASVANFSDCLDLILDRIGPDDSDDSHLTQSACTLYGLIHARYIITSHGLDGMYNKYVNKDFGTCPLLQCYNQPVLPVGLRDDIGSDTVKIFCPKCQCVYHPPPIRPRSHSIDDIGSANVDGSAFGTTFAHLFLMTFHTLVPEGLTQESAYIPRIFGFRLHKTAKSRNDVGAASNSISTTSPSIRSRRSHTSSATTAANLNTADQDAADAAADDSTRAPLGHVGQEDNTAASSAIAANNNGNEINSTKGSGLLINKKGAKGKNAEDSGASSKRKGKSSSNGDVEGITKRQKRPNSKT